ncbi:S24 family peptidase [uncultured Muribaculum sp.]|uniref:S24 family peptidase n=1 Tax=uncultured Muribaculum sp. TaxID=1918613 RepID=UPI00266F5DF4|nr:S24 family peptidase [uncultured Muribaculum sp.]
MKTIDRIKEIAADNDITLTEMERIIGASKGVLTRAASKGTNIQLRWLEAIADNFPGWNAEWILTGKGEPSDIKMKSIVVKNPEESEDDISHEDKYLVPLVPIGVFAGPLTGFDIERVDACACEMVVCPIPEMDWALEVVGDSMESEYPNGSRVFVKKINSAIFLEWGCVYVIDTENGLVMKSIQPSPNPKYITCVSLNPRYAPFDIPKESIRAMYRVRACLALK